MIFRFRVNCGGHGRDGRTDGQVYRVMWPTTGQPRDKPLVHTRGRALFYTANYRKCDKNRMVLSNNNTDGIT